jgi:hypothetical protein
MVAGVRRAAGHAVMLALNVAFLTPGEAVRPALLPYVFETGIIIRKFAVKVRYRIAQLFCTALLELPVLFTLRVRAHDPTCIQGIFLFAFLQTEK